MGVEWDGTLNHPWSLYLVYTIYLQTISSMDERPDHYLESSSGEL